MYVLHFRSFVISTIVRVVPLKESDALLLLALLDRLFGVAASLLVNLYMVTDTQSHEIVWIETHALHRFFALVNHRLNRHLVMDVHRQRVNASPPFGIAYLAVPLRLCQLPRPQLLPSFRVQQLLVSWVSAHTLTILHHAVATVTPPTMQGSRLLWLPLLASVVSPLPYAEIYNHSLVSWCSPSQSFGSGAGAS